MDGVFLEQPNVYGTLAKNCSMQLAADVSILEQNSFRVFKTLNSTPHVLALNTILDHVLYCVCGVGWGSTEVEYCEETRGYIPIYLLTGTIFRRKREQFKRKLNFR